MASKIPSRSLGITKRSRGYLPHWERNNGTYFVTFRLGDSLPKAVLEELLRHKRMLAAAKESGRRLLAVESVTEQRLSSRKMEAYLDSGSIHFGQPQEG